MYIVIIMLALHLKKVASIIKWMTQVWYTRKNISWSRCHHKSRSRSLFICINISGKYDESDHKLTAIRAFTLVDQASERYYLCWRWYHTMLWVDLSCDIPKHHDDEDSHLWVSILQVVSLPWADFTLVQHLWKIDLDHPSCWPSLLSLS